MTLNKRTIYPSPKTFHRLDYLIKFIIGGSVIVGVTRLPRHADSRYGSMLAAAPIITTLAFLFTYSEAGRRCDRV